MTTISVIVCTYNRAELLSRCLRSLEGQTLDRSLFEVLVIDNNSSDATRETAEAFRDRLPGFRVIPESMQGLSRARNRGWAESRGNYIAFIDDDAVAEPGWLSEILSTFSSVVPEPDACGGRVGLEWESPRPGWMDDSLLVPLGAFDYGDSDFFIRDPGGFLSGSNIAIRRDVSEIAGRFDPSLGRQGTNLLSNDEVDLCRRMQRVNLTLYYNPRILVNHRVANERLTKQWHYDRAYWQGRSAAIMDDGNDPGCISGLVRKGATAGKLAYYTLHGIVSTDERVRVRDRVKVSRCRGYLSRTPQDCGQVQ